MSRGNPFRQINFTGGLNTKASPYLVAANECRDCLNVVTTTRGSVKKRPGISSFVASGFGAGATQIQGLFGAHTVPTAGNVLVAIDEDGEVYSVSTGATVTDINLATFTGTPLDTSIIQAPVSSGTSQGPIFFNNPTASYRWTGSGNIAAWTALTGTVPTGAYMVYFKNRVWVAGQSANPSSLFWSDLNAPGVWPTANVTQFDPNDGDVITGLGVAGPYLLVFKTSKTFVVYDLDAGAQRPLSTQLGCASHRSIVETPKGTFFLTKDKGIWVTDGKRLTQLSEKITPTLDGIIPAQRNRAAGSYLNDHYYLSICTTGSTNNLTLDYDTTTGSWWKHSNTANQFALWRPTNEQQLYAAIPTAARIDRVYDPALLTDNAASLLANWIGPWLTFNEPYRNKRIRQIHVDGTGIVDAYIGTDFNASNPLFKSDIFTYSGVIETWGGGGVSGGAGTFGGSSFQLRRRLYPGRVFRAISFQVQATSDQPFEMDAYTSFTTLRQS